MLTFRSSIAVAAIAAIFVLSDGGSARADDMSDMADWCAKVSAPSNVIICSDPELRQMAVIRNKIFADARASLPADEMKGLSADQKQWVHEYTAACGASVDGPPVSLPVSQGVVDCYKRAGRDRVAELVRDLRQAIPDYRVPTISGGSFVPALATATPQPTTSVPQPPTSTPVPAVSSDQAEREKAAEKRRRQIEAQAAQEKLTAKLKELGFQLLAPVDLDLDWRNLLANNVKVAIHGTYLEANDVEELSTPDNKDQPSIRLYTDSASRSARKVMLECRNSNFEFSSCDIVVGGTVQSCVRHKGELNEKEIPCIKVEEAFVNPQITALSGAPANPSTPRLG